MAYNANEIVKNLALDAYNVIQVEKAADFDLDIYFASTLADVVYAASVADPNAAFGTTGLTSGEIEAARQSLQAVSTLLEANDGLHRKALTRIISARPT